MVMRIGRTLPPAASPFYLKDIVSGVAGFFEGVGIVERFEDELKSFYQVRYCFAVSSGKAALFLILQALHEIFPEKDEVLIPAYTCYSVPSAITRAGLKIRLCDMAPGTLDFDFDHVAEELENPRLLCVVPTHLFGMPTDVERLKTLIGRRGIFVLEDAAQAMGGEWNGNKMGTQGDVGLFSLGRGKAFSTVEGGIILTDNDQIGRILKKRLAAVKRYRAIDSLKLIINAVALLILISPRLYWLPKSLPFLKLGETHFNPSFPLRRLSPFQAGVAHTWNSAINGLKLARAANAAKIRRYGIGLTGFCRGVITDLIRFPVLVADTETKKRILWSSERMGLGISDGYPDSIDGIAELRGSFAGKSFPVAKDLAERIVTLPVHPYVNEDDIQRITQLFEKPIQSNKRVRMSSTNHAGGNEIKPLVSICIPNYNGDRYLRDCLDTAIAQTYQNTEILIVDNQSTDSSIEIASEYCSKDRRIRLVQNDKNIGPIGNFNRCLSLAKGEWVKFLFHDDLLNSACIERMLEASVPGVPIIACDRELIFDGCSIEYEEGWQQFVQKYNLGTLFPKMRLIPPNKVCEAVLSNKMINFVGEPTAVLLHRSVFSRFGLFNEHLIQICDLEYWIRIASNEGLVYLPEKLACFRLHEKGGSATNHASRKFRISIDELICFHDFVFSPNYAQLRRYASLSDPPVNLGQIFASDVKSARKIAKNAATASINPNASLMDELNNIMTIFPGFNLIKKIPCSLSYGNFKWKIRKYLEMPEPLHGHKL